MGFSTHSFCYCVILGHHGRLPMDGVTRTRKTSLGRTTGELLAQFPPRLAHGSCTILSMHAHHETVRPHAIPSSLPYPELSYSVVVCILFCQCLQRDVHFCIAILLLPGLSSMVRTKLRCFTLLELTDHRDITVSEHKCINRTALYIAYTVMNSISTWWILLMPMPIVWSLALKNDQKYLLTSLFALGSLPCVTSIARLKVLVDWLHHGANDNDITYTLWDIVLWT